VLSKLQTITASTAKEIDNLRFSEAFDTLYHFIWDDVADWYLEASKSDQNPTLLAYVLESILKLLHPFAPFVTETIWQTLDMTGNDVLITQAWPTPQQFKADKKIASEFEAIRTIVTEARFITSRLGVQKCTLYYTDAPFLGANAELIAKLAKLASVKQVESGQGMHLTSTTYDCWLDIDSHTAREYVSKLKADKDTKVAIIDRLEARLSSKEYVSKAPKTVVEQTREQLATETELLAKLEKEVQTFSM
jgi:valyl-tRNA synthetase